MASGHGTNEKKRGKSPERQCAEMLSPEKTPWVVTPLSGLKLIHRGKVRDTYSLEGDYMLVVATDRVSIFDFVLGTPIPGKGEILTAMTVFWLKMIERELEIDHHMVACGAEIDNYLPGELRGNPLLQARALVVRRFKMLPVEFVMRGCLTGSGWKEYQKSGTLFGVPLPTGLADGDLLATPQFTPTTKAEVGHDMPMSVGEVLAKYPAASNLARQIFDFATTYARERGIMFADTKFEFGEEGLADEVITPDSSRFWLLREWLDSSGTGKVPTALDKQSVREWGKSLGIDKLSPEVAGDRALACTYEIPDNVVRDAQAAYRFIFWKLTGELLEDFWKLYGVRLDPPRRRISIVLGSESDKSTFALGWKNFIHSARNSKAEVIRANVASCHRNPDDLRRWVRQRAGNADVIIAIGGKALALPGIIDAWSYQDNPGDPIRVIGVAIGDPGSRSLEAAKLSIEELPGAPVITDDGRAFEGVEGITQALLLAAQGELPPPKARKQTEARFDLDPATLCF